MIRTTVAIVILGLAGGTAQASVALHETTLYNFAKESGAPTTGLVSGGGGVFYLSAGRSIYSLSRNAAKQWQVKVIYAFAEGVTTNGLIVSGGVIYGIDGQSIFALTRSKKAPVTWTKSVVHTFTASGKGASEPAGMASPGPGVLYLTTRSGGGASGCGEDNNVPVGCGTLFQLKLASGKWTGTLLHAFAGGSDGALPMAAPSLDRAGNIYYSTYLGGYSAANARSRSNAKINPDNSQQGSGTVGEKDDPDEDSKNDDDKTDEDGGDSDEDYATTVLPESLGSEDDTANYLIGSSLGGGNSLKCEAAENNGCGGVFVLVRPAKKSRLWTYRKLHFFSGPDGEMPFGGFLLNGGLVYGLAYGGNHICAYPAQSFGCGVIYALKFTSAGAAYAGTAYKFTGVKDGALPNDGLVAWQGQILGLTSAGGKNNAGTIFALTP